AGKASGNPEKIAVGRLGENGFGMPREALLLDVESLHFTGQGFVPGLPFVPGAPQVVDAAARGNTQDQRAVLAFEDIPTRVGPRLGRGARHIHRTDLERGPRLAAVGRTV